MRPGVSVVEDIDGGVSDVFGLHDLDADKPRRVVTLFDGVVDVLDVIVRLGARQPEGRVCIHGLDAFLGPEVPLDVDIASILDTVRGDAVKRQRQRTHRLVECVSMDAEAVDVPQGRRDAALPEEVHQRMNPLRVVQMEVPEHGVIGDVGPWVALVAPVHGRELDGVADKEDGQIIEDEVLDAILGVELGRPATNVADCVTGALLAADRGDSREDLGLLPHLRQELGIGQVGDVVEDLELAHGTSGLCVDAPTSQTRVETGSRTS